MVKASLSKELMGKLVETILFMERFYDKMKGHKSDIDFTVSMDENQKNKWLTSYYPQLIASDIIADDRFFAPDGSKKNYGVGNDGAFRVSEYCNIMYQLYKTLVNYSGSVWEADKEVLACIRMLEPYVWCYAGEHDMKKTISMSAEHKKLWKEQFFPNLVETKKIPDYSFFDESNKNTGIGADGCFNGAELLHFLYQCYKYICNPNFSDNKWDRKMIDLFNKTFANL